MESAIRTILCATDLSQASRPALASASALSRRCGARLLVMHAVDFPAEPLSELPPQETRALKGGRMARALGEIEALRRESGLDITLLVDRGHPARALLRTAREAHIDLVVLTSYGLTGFKRFFCDTVVERLIVGLPCPLLVLRGHRDAAGADDAPWMPRSLLLAVDLGRAAIPVLRFGATLARACGAPLHLLHAVEAPEPAELEMGTALPLEKAQRQFLEAQRQRLLLLVAEADAGGSGWEAAVRTGPPADAIRQYAGECGADLLVVGGRPHRGMARLAPCPTARSLLRRSRRCLAVVPPPADAPRGAL
jgi:nucleotide-binding universal stress UspA family protein